MVEFFFFFFLKGIERLGPHIANFKSLKEDIKKYFDSLGVS